MKERNQGGAYTLVNELDEEMLPRRTIDMLKPLQSSEKLKERVSKDKNYEVEFIVDHRKTKDGDEYLVKWKDYFESDNSWIKASNFNSQKPIKQYWARWKKQRKKQVKKTWPITDQRSRGESCEAKSEKGGKFQEK